MKDSEIFAKAREIHKERGYHKGAYINPVTGQEVCAYGALRLAVGSDIEMRHGHGYAIQWTQDKNWGEIGYRLAKYAGINFVPAFNDDESTSSEDIDLMWKIAIYEAEEAEEDENAGN